MTKSNYLARTAAAALLVSAMGAGTSSTPAEAQIAERAIQGAIGGAVIGGVARGKRGIGPGAAIGAAAGAVVGAVEADRRRKYRKRRTYRRATTARQVSRHDPLVYDTQAALTNLGYQPGPVDGVWGKKTSNAISAYQDENGLLVTGVPSDALLAHMGKSSNSPTADYGSPTDDDDVPPPSSYGGGPVN